MAKQYSFNDKALDQAIKSSASQFTNFQKLLDETSEDIKSLEKWLQDCGVCIATYVSVDSGTNIGWDKHGDQWRLICDTYSHHQDESPDDSRPLAETSAKMRLSSKPHLVSLVYEISKILPKAEESQIEQKNKKQVNLLSSVNTPFANQDEIPF